VIGAARVAAAAILSGIALAATVAAQREALAALPKTDRAIEHCWFAPGFVPVELPGKGPPRGIACVGDRVWLARGEQLLGFDRDQLGRGGGDRDGVAAKVTRPLPEGLCALCDDERHLYALCGEAPAVVHVLDARAGVEMRRFPLAFDEGAAGEQAASRIVTIGASRERGLGVLTARSFRIVDPATGKVVGKPRRPLGVMSRIQWLQASGPGWLLGNSIGTFALMTEQDQDPAAVMRRHRTNLHTWLPLRLDRSCGTFVNGQLLLVAERRHRGELVAGLVAPSPAQPPIVLHVHRPGRTERWSVGYGKRQPRAGALEQLAAKLAAWRERHPGQRAVVHLGTDPEVEIGALLEAWDAIAAMELGPEVCFPALSGR